MAESEKASRWLDPGISLAAFTDEFFVECPECSRQAKVVRSWNRDHLHWRRAGATCTKCGFSQRAEERLFCPRCPLSLGGDSQSPVMLSARCRCGDCGAWLQSDVRVRVPPTDDSIEMTCGKCKHTTRSSYTLYPPPKSSGPVDLCFGFPLWMQTDCEGETLWAFNIRHLFFLRGYLGATLWEKGGNTKAAAARLPTWLRRMDPATALRAVSRLEKRLLEKGA